MKEKATKAVSRERTELEYCQDLMFALVKDLKLKVQELLEEDVCDVVMKFCVLVRMDMVWLC